MLKLKDDHMRPVKGERDLSQNHFHQSVPRTRKMTRREEADRSQVLSGRSSPGPFRRRRPTLKVKSSLEGPAHAHLKDKRPTAKYKPCPKVHSRSTSRSCK
ncbi:hypothetical protein TNCT_307301 [Trichonephila clavata]|uniref:Uncharacterized protein n=1 Tax=Trichonephila clavata TaxID=2740835 RepID=A0A8X6J8G2_TRICU|nr:hypothetical protein TNCT_307301 [Trichonephila clavata]